MGWPAIMDPRMTKEEVKLLHALRRGRRDLPPCSTYRELWTAWHEWFVDKYSNQSEQQDRVDDIYETLVKLPHADHAMTGKSAGLPPPPPVLSLDIFPTVSTPASPLATPVSASAGSPVASPVRDVASPAPVDTATPVREAPVEASVIVALEKRLASLEALLTERINALQDEVSALRGDVERVSEQVQDATARILAAFGEHS